MLPPLQSVVDLTAAVRPPSRGLDLGGGGEAAAAAASDAVSDGVAVPEEEVVGRAALGRQLADGAGRLADGTRCVRGVGVEGREGGGGWGWDGWGVEGGRVGGRKGGPGREERSA